eukprot:6192122-Pleurochrysis_carterae.AAC.2
MTLLFAEFMIGTFGIGRFRLSGGSGESEGLVSGAASAVAYSLYGCWPPQPSSMSGAASAPCIDLRTRQTSRAQPGAAPATPSPGYR